MQTTPSFKEILAIAIPLMLGGISESIAAVVDTAFMGRLGTETMDGMGMTNIFLLLIIMIGWSLSRSVQILVSQNFGAQKLTAIGSVFQNALMVLLPISLLLLILLCVFSKSLMSIIVADTHISEISAHILSIRACGLPFLMATMVFSSLQTGLGKTKILILSQGVAAVSNIILNYILVFGHFGMPAMGYEGSAWATVISEVFGLMIMLCHQFAQRNEHQVFQLWKMPNYQPHIIRNIFRLASPMMILHFFSIGAWVYFFSLIEKMGATELAISFVLKQIFTTITLPGFSLANTSNTLVGQLVGARRLDLVLPTIKKVALINCILLMSLAVLTYLFRMPIVKLFTVDSFVIAGFTPALIALLTSYFFIPIANVFFGSVSALGNTRIPLYLELSVIVLYLAYIFFVTTCYPRNLWLAWTSETFYWSILACMTIGYFYFSDWKKRVVYLDGNT